jgi:hypothetical protein
MHGSESVKTFGTYCSRVVRNNCMVHHPDKTGLWFVVPCIFKYSYKTTNQMHRSVCQTDKQTTAGNTSTSAYIRKPEAATAV